MWKGAISFGLVHIPVEMHSAARDNALSFAMLDKRVVPTVREALTIGKGRAAFARDSAGYGAMVEIGYLVVSRIGPEKLLALCRRAKAEGAM